MPAARAILGFAALQSLRDALRAPSHRYRENPLAAWRLFIIMPIPLCPGESIGCSRIWTMAVEMQRLSRHILRALRVLGIPRSVAFRLMPSPNLFAADQLTEAERNRSQQ